MLAVALLRLHPGARRLCRWRQGMPPPRQAALAEPGAGSPGSAVPNIHKGSRASPAFPHSFVVTLRNLKSLFSWRVKRVCGVAMGEVMLLPSRFRGNSSNQAPFYLLICSSGRGGGRAQFLKGYMEPGSNTAFRQRRWIIPCLKCRCCTPKTCDPCYPA